MEFFRGGPSNELEEVEAWIVGMLRDGNDVFTAATDALFGGGKSKATKREVRDTDKGINEAQQDVRRTLMIHAAVNGPDLPLVLQYASIVKDAERVGDYSKNIYELIDLYGKPEKIAIDKKLIESAKNITGLFRKVKTAFIHGEEREALPLLDQLNTIKKGCDR